ncbi:hypothetical protein NDU88_006964 [Pleurodeles waltl]|uniref:Uncharacterized protein n=1 Tax=Pleurodeles waltl TaxID=8319 RepID=A0AAV7VS60_PLEWA|nr:hypothetical protein NDU88_006964 [Pleurodeles waltl]
MECSPNRFQVVEETAVGEAETISSTGQNLLPLSTNEVQNGELLGADMDGISGLHQSLGSGKKVPSRVPSLAAEGLALDMAEGQVLGMTEESGNQSITRMLIALSLEVKSGFEVSSTNQKEIRGLCEALGENIDDLAGRRAALEEEVGGLRTEMERNREEIQSLKTREESVLSKLESLEIVTEGII